MRRFACLLGLLSLFSVAVAGQTPVELSSARGLLCLNGTWRFQPAVGPADAAPSGAWGEALVPGSWSGTQCLPGLAKTATNAIRRDCHRAASNRVRQTDGGWFRVGWSMAVDPFVLTGRTTP